MAKKAPSFHSEFKQRLVIAVRAPEGDSQRAVALRRLVEEMNERHETGHLNEWLIDALLDRIARDSLSGGSLSARVVELSPAKRNGGHTESAEPQRSEERAEGHKTVADAVPQAIPEQQPVRVSSMNPGLRVMG